MKESDLNRKFLEKGFTICNFTFLEEGYEIKLRKLKGDDFANEDNKDYDIVESIDYGGLAINEITRCRGRFCILLIPVELDEMTDFVWKYVEKLGKRQSSIEVVLREAMCVLENIVSNAKEESRKRAKENYERFAGMIF